MTTTGGRKKPAAMKELEGNRSKIAKAEFDKQIARAAKGNGRPKVPGHLSPIERGLWRDVVGSLPETLLSRADDAVLERFVVAWARFRDTQAMLVEEGYTVTTKYGTFRNPLLVVQKQASDEMHKAGAEIGLSPVSRARLMVDAEGDPDPMAQLLGDTDAGGWALPSRTPQ